MVPCAVLKPKAAFLSGEGYFFGGATRRAICAGRGILGSDRSFLLLAGDYNQAAAERTTEAQRHRDFLKELPDASSLTILAGPRARMRALVAAARGPGRRRSSPGRARLAWRSRPGGRLGQRAGCVCLRNGQLSGRRTRGNDDDSLLLLTNYI
jgi:hypothetical protein